MIILSVGGLLYGRFCAHVFGPDDRPTAAVAKRDGIVYVPMKKWRNALIELLNIAGTGPVLGPIQGILFGPVAFILIPIGCVLGGAVHDYFCGMMSVRHDGRQMPGLVEGYLSRGTYHVFNVFICLLMFLLGVVFIYTPGDMIVGSIMGLNTSFTAADGGFVGFGAIAPLFVVYALIFVYYLLATFLPIDKIIGRIYPIFGAILLLSAGGIFVALFATGGVQMLDELCGQWSSWVSIDNIVPMFFVTVTCGIVSGFHNSQAWHHRPFGQRRARRARYLLRHDDC